MTHCSAGEKAEVMYTKNGVKSKFETDNTPIDVECSEKQRTGKFIFTLKDYGYAGDCQSSGIQFTDTVIADTYQVQSATNSGQFASCGWNEISFYVGDSKISSFLKTIRYSVTPEPNPNYSPGSRTLVIKNAQGTKLFEAQVKDCNYAVACGDGCPPGQRKCTIDKYPGYCCQDCAGTAGKINNLAGKVGKIRG